MKSRKPAFTKNYKQLGLIALVILAVAITGVYLQGLRKYQKLATYPNQACLGIGIALKNGFNLGHYDFDGRSVARSEHYGYVGQHKCTIGTVVTKQGQNSTEGYQLGSDVIYFKNAASAYKYAEKVVNSMHYWGIDQEGQKNNIPQTSLFTFLHTEAKEPYFDAYTVRDKEVVLLTLPCNNISSDPGQNFGQCQAAAENVLKQFADTVQKNLFAKKLF